MNEMIDLLEKEHMRLDLPEIGTGDNVRVHTKIYEGDKERIQVYGGTVIARNGGGASETFTVRRISFGEGVERVFPLHSPYVAKVEVERSGAARRAKLYYMRKLTGKQSRLKEIKEEQE